jgi:hypothetical protein
MSEAYWLGGYHQDVALPSDVEDRLLFAERYQLLTALTGKFGLTAARLNRVDWFTGRMNGLYKREALGENGPRAPLAFLWPNLPLLSHSLLRNACAGLAAEEATLIAMVEKNQTAAEAALLGSPAAVGVYNLAPQSRLVAHMSAGWETSPLADTFEAVASFLKKLEVDPAELTSLALASPVSSDKIEKPEVWKDAAWFSAPIEQGVLTPLNWLAAKLQADTPALGLLVSLSADHRALFTLVERV